MINRKPKITDNVIIISLALMVFFVFQDLLGYRMWSLIGGYTTDVYAAVQPLYMQQFWLFAYTSIAVVAITYYLIKKDWSETLALITTPMILLWFGLHDLLYWVFGNVAWTAADGTYLYAHMPVAAFISDLIGISTINITSLIASSAVGVVLAYFVYKALLKAKW